MTSPEGTDEAVEAAARAEFEHDTSGSTLWPLAGAWGETVAWSRQVYAKRAAAGIAAAAPYIAAKALRDYADANHAFGGGVGAVWTPAGPIDPDAWCTCGASWAEDGCTEREQLLARADEIERAARAAGKDGTDG